MLVSHLLISKAGTSALEGGSAGAALILNGAVGEACSAVTVTHGIYGVDVGLLEAKVRVRGLERRIR